MTLNTSLSGVIYHVRMHNALVLLCINQQTKFDVLSFTHSKDMIGANLKNGSRDHGHAPSRVVVTRKL